MVWLFGGRLIVAPSCYIQIVRAMYWQTINFYMVQFQECNIAGDRDVTRNSEVWEYPFYI